jgi:Tat protein secretion system quality control protein TatD with DNase activity
VVAAIPEERLMIETDCPWCEIRPSHAGRKHVRTTRESKDKKKHSEDALVKGRNEPCNLRQVLEVLAGKLNHYPDPKFEADVTSGSIFRSWDALAGCYCPASLMLKASKKYFS